MAECIIEACIKPSRRLKMCIMHYTRIRRYGDVNFTKIEKHGMSKTPIYILWCNIIARCEDKNNTSYRNYGGRGITICDKWRKSFSAFYSDIGDIPIGKELDRRNNNGNYELDNIRWVTQQENCNNRFYEDSGTFLNKKLNKYQTEIRYNGIRYYLGLFKTFEEGKAAYQKKAKELGRIVS